MFEHGAMLFLYVATPTHVGAGISETTDLAIQRNATTGWPMVQASGLKGALRDAAPAANDIDVLKQAIVFGYDKDARGAKRVKEAEAYPAGALAVGDAAVIAFPIASLKGVFAWVTCDAAIRELQRIWKLLPGSRPTSDPSTSDPSNYTHPVDGEPLNPAQDKAVCEADSAVVISNNQIVLQDIVLERVNTGNAAEVTNLAAWLADCALADQPVPVKDKLKTDLVLVNDSTFATLVEFGIHTITRVKIDDETGTAAASGPWDEELLPAETLLFAPVFATAPRREKANANGKTDKPDKDDDAPIKTAAEVFNYFQNSVTKRDGEVNHFQIGAGVTVGWGFISPALLANTPIPPSPNSHEPSDTESAKPGEAATSQEGAHA